MSLLDLVFAPHCSSCDRRLRDPAPFCDPCAESLYELGSACPRCAEPIEGPLSIRCASCARRPPPVLATSAPYRYGGELAVAIKRLKLNGRADIARCLLPLYREPLRRASEDVSLVIPIPLHWRRLSARGFNQSALMLDLTRKELSAPIDKLALRRRSSTPTQAGLDPKSRRKNVAGAFDVPARYRERIRGVHVLLVDDVITTGATIAEAARTLLGHGASSVRAFALARRERGG